MSEENKWKNIVDCYIPPVEKKGFQENVIIRKYVAPIWLKSQIQEPHPIMRKEKAEIDKETFLLSHPMQEVDLNKTVLIQRQEDPVYQIRRIGTGESIAIKKLSFEMGKLDSCDFIISDNPAISRHHAKVLQNDGKYYLVDEGSMNHTYIAGKIIEEAILLEENMEFVLANENFVFEREK